jgi:hypothetical protein
LPPTDAEPTKSTCYGLEIFTAWRLTINIKLIGNKPIAKV